MSSVGPLAIFEGFWGQIFEYWPFFGTVGVTLGFGAISLMADLWWRRTTPPPAGAEPRVAIPVDPRTPYRRWISRGRTLLRFGCGMGVLFGLIYAMFSISPQGLNDQFGLTQQRDNALAAGAVLALAVFVVGYASTVMMRERLVQQMWIMALVPVVGLLAPWVITGDITKLYASAGVVGAAILFVLLGMVYTYFGIRGLSSIERQTQSPVAAQSG